MIDIIPSINKNHNVMFVTRADTEVNVMQGVELIINCSLPMAYQFDFV
jgi:hypothetical protein